MSEPDRIDVDDPRWDCDRYERSYVDGAPFTGIKEERRDGRLIERSACRHGRAVHYSVSYAPDGRITLIDWYGPPASHAPPFARFVLDEDERVVDAERHAHGREVESAHRAADGWRFERVASAPPDTGPPLADLLADLTDRLATDRLFNFPDILPEPSPEDWTPSGETLRDHLMRAGPNDLERLARFQRRCAGMVQLRPLPRPPSTICGLDLQHDHDEPPGPEEDTSVAAAATWNIETGEATIRTQTMQGDGFGYRPGFLAYREALAMAGIYERHAAPADVLMVDGGGTLHPRGFGLACAVGVLTGVPTIGIAKKPPRSLGRACIDALGTARGAVDLIDDFGVGYGAMVRTADGVRPVWISPGHLITREEAVEITLRASRHRVPEPIRSADHAARHPDR